MGAKDSKAKEYLSANDRFADLFNFFVFDGKQVIKPEDLHELDSTEVLSVYGTEFKELMVQKWRDLLKSCTMKTSPDFTLIVLGVENQSDIHYAMPVKNMIYDALTYGNQVNEASRKHRTAAKAGSKEYDSNAEFLSGFKKTDKLTPVITLTVYWGADQWDGPLRLRDMFRENVSELMEYIDDYKVNLIAPNQIEDFSGFQTELGEVLEFIKYSKSDGDTMKKVLEHNAAFQNLSYESACVINQYTGLEMDLKKERRVNMCQAVQDMVNKGKEAGLTEGLAKGLTEGREEGLAKGLTEGRISERTSIVINMFNLKTPIETIATLVNDSVENVKQMLASAGIAVK